MPATLGWCNLAAMRGSRHRLWIVAVFAGSLIACAASEPESEVGGGGWSGASSGDESEQSGGVVAERRSAANESDDELVVTGSRTASPFVTPYGYWAFFPQGGLMSINNAKRRESLPPSSHLVG